MNSKISIMIVDDSDFDRRLLGKALTIRLGCKIVEISNGMDCLKYLKNNANKDDHKPNIDLILLDVVMQEMDGNSLLREIRKEYNPIELPIVMISGRKDASDIIISLQSGANDYISKPVQFDIVLSRITTQLRLSELSRHMTKLEKVKSMQAMIATYNHEINNPLTIVIGSLDLIELEPQNTENLETARQAVWRIAEIVKKIYEISQSENFQYDSYLDETQMIKVNKESD